MAQDRSRSVSPHQLLLEENTEKNVVIQPQESQECIEIDTPDTSRIQWSINSQNKNANTSSRAKTDNRSRKTQYHITQFTHTPIPLKQSKKIDHQLIKLIVSDYLRFALVENNKFIWLLKILNSNYNLLSTKTSKQILIQVYRANWQILPKVNSSQ